MSGKMNGKMSERVWTIILLSLFRYPISRDYSDDIITQTWFIILLGSIIAIIVFLFGATILFRKIQYIKHNSLTSVHGELFTFYII